MPCAQAEAWGFRALGAMSRGGIDIAPSIFAMGMAGLSVLGLKAFLSAPYDEARPLLQALIDEVNRLIHRVRRITRQNHLLLSRTVQLHQGLLRQFYPGAFTSTYSAFGRLSMAPAAPLPAFRAAG